MKKVFAILAIAGFMVACNNSTTETKTDAMKDTAAKIMNNAVDTASKMMNNAADSASKMMNNAADSVKAKVKM